MLKKAAITIRVPTSLRRRLESRAEAQHRSLSAQILAELERVSEEQEPSAGASGRFLGLFAGTSLPTDQDIGEVRRVLWGTLARRA